MLVTLSMFILLVEPVTLGVLGNAAFFGCIVSIMIPPTMPVMLFVFAMMTLLMGMLTGWAWSCAAMAASLAARDKVLLASQVQRVQASLAGATNPDSLYSLAIFQGKFLDARSTVVFGVFFWIGTFCLGLLRAKIPKLVLLAVPSFQIFGTIVMDVMVSYGALFPIAQYTLAVSLVLCRLKVNKLIGGLRTPDFFSSYAGCPAKSRPRLTHVPPVPTTFFMAVALAATAIIFPETLNSSWTTDLVDRFLIPVFQRSQLHSKVFSTAPPSEETPVDAWSGLHGQFLGSGAAVSGGLDAVLGSVGFMELEVSYGRLGAKDLIGLTELLRELTSRAMSLGVFANAVQSGYKRSSARETALKAPVEAGKSQVFEHRMDRARRRALEAEAKHSHNLGSLLPILESTSSALRTACDDALLSAMTWLTNTNSTRWMGRPTPNAVEEAYQAQHTRIALLESLLAEFRTDGRAQLCGRFRDRFDENGELTRTSNETSLPFSPASLFMCLAASSNFIWYAEALLAFVKHLHELEDKRRVNKVWFPTGVRKIGHLLRGGRPFGEAANGNPEKIEQVGSDEDTLHGEEVDEIKDALGSAARDPDAKPPKNVRQRISTKLYAFGNWLHTPEAIFALRYSTISVLLWLPQIFPRSAYFTYTEKGLWALIMGQTGLAVFSGDQISQSIQKLAGTAVGLVYGMLIWYIGSGTGSGNRIGLGAAFFVFMIPALAIRLYGPPQYMQSSIMGSITVVLVVGYSWTDAHLATIGNAGVGVNIAWRRALLVVIGMTAATLAMIFPKPTSARRVVRQTQATCIEEVGKIYAGIVGAWLSEQQSDELATTEKGESSPLNPSPFSVEAQKRARGRALALYIKLKGIRMSIGQAGFELSLRGDWPVGDYSELLEKQMAIVEALGQLGIALIHLDSKWRQRLVVKTAFLNPNLIADVTSSIYLISMALRLGTPLPETTPGPLLDRLLYHEEKRQHHRAQHPPTKKTPDSDSDSDDESENTHQIEGAATGKRLTFETLKDERFAMYATAILALASILANVDEMEVVAKRLVGEVRFPGFDRLKQRRGADESA
ncbi:hypothetical protein P7C70_g3975, partial [Phenoliferia sp. Uapishka_3]